MNGRPSDRPASVTLMSVTFFVISIASMVVGEIMAMQGAIVIPGGTEVPYYTFGAIQAIVSGAIYLILSYGYWEGWRGIWYAGVIFLAVCLVMGVFEVTATDIFSIVLVITEAVLFIGMFRKDVRMYCHAGRLGNADTQDQKAH